MEITAARRVEIPICPITKNSIKFYNLEFLNTINKSTTKLKREKVPRLNFD